MNQIMKSLKNHISFDIIYEKILELFILRKNKWNKNNQETLVAYDIFRNIKFRYNRE